MTDEEIKRFKWRINSNAYYERRRKPPRPLASNPWAAYMRAYNRRRYATDADYAERQRTRAREHQRQRRSQSREE